MDFIRSITQSQKMNGLQNTLVKIDTSNINNSSNVSMLFTKKFKLQLYDLAIMKERHRSRRTRESDRSEKERRREGERRGHELGVLEG